MRRAITIMLALATVLFTNVAMACPVCASREEAGTLRWVALGAFVVSPWIVVGVIAYFIRRGDLFDEENIDDH